MVPAAVRRLAEGHLPRRPGTAGVSREHLPTSVTGDNGTRSEEDRLSSVPATFTYIVPEEVSLIRRSGWRISSRPKRPRPGAMTFRWLHQLWLKSCGLT